MKKTILWTLTGTALFLILGIIVWNGRERLFAGHRSESTFRTAEGEKIDPALAELVRFANMLCPEQVDPFTVLDSIVLKSNTALNNYYTVTFDEEVWEIYDRESLQLIICENVHEAVRTDPSLENLRLRGFTFGMIYLEPDGNLFVETEITPVMYR